MPNWCYNRLVVSGPKVDRERFLLDMQVAGLELNPKEPPLFTFHGILPMPKELEGTTSPRPRTRDELRATASKYGWSAADLQWALDNALTPEMEQRLDSLKVVHGHDNWYDWCMAVWGVKWDASNVTICRYTRGVTIIYETAWGPPEGVLHALAAKYPTLKFRNHYRIEGWPGKDVVEGDASVAELMQKEREAKIGEQKALVEKIFGA